MRYPGQLAAHGKPDRGLDWFTRPGECLPGTPWAGLRLPLPSARVFGGVAGQLAAVRRYVRSELAGHPALDAAELTASELAANAITHTASGQPGGTFEVQLARLGGAHAVVLVADQGARTRPTVQHAAPDAESGRGLDLVTSLAAAFTVLGDPGGRAILAILPA